MRRELPGLARPCRPKLVPQYLDGGVFTFSLCNVAFNVQPEGDPIIETSGPLHRCLNLQSSRDRMFGFKDDFAARNGECHSATSTQNFAPTNEFIFETGADLIPSISTRI